MLETKSLSILLKAIQRLEPGFSDLPSFEGKIDETALQNTLAEVAEHLKDNFPYFHPLYAGQMLKPPHPVARAAYMLAMWINPNNHALDGGRASSAMEKEAVAAIAAMFNWETFLGHLTSGGTMANLEALWISGKLNPDKTILASSQSHYTHSRISEVLGLSFKTVPCDNKAQLDLVALEETLQEGNIGTVVATVGTTGVGSIDPIPGILELKDRFDFRLHIDAAYGGYFILSNNLSEYGRKVFDALHLADSIVIDPHKHGLQPYGCGSVLFKDPGVGRFYKHDSPYTYFSSNELHLGEISLECSRAGASAVGLWATQKMLPMTRDGEFTSNLSKCRRAAQNLYSRLKTDSRFLTFLEPELDIVVWAPRAGSAADISLLSQQIFDLTAKNNLHLALFNYPSEQLKEGWPEVDFDQDTVICLRSCLMKPEHEDWMDTIWQILDQAII